MKEIEPSYLEARSEGIIRHHAVSPETTENILFYRVFRRFSRIIVAFQTLAHSDHFATKVATKSKGVVVLALRFAQIIYN